MNLPFDPEAFRGRRVLITGDTGFKGSWLALWLTKLGAQVWGFAHPPEGESPHYTLLGLADRITHHDGDIRNRDDVQKIVDAAKPEIVFHLAAQSLVRKSYESPKLTFDTNFGGGVNLLDVLRDTPSVRALVFITSDKCYLNKEWDWGYRETDELGGLDPYSASKAATELAFKAYAASYLDANEKLGAATTRAGNVIGGGDWADNRIVPDCIRALKDGQPIRIRMPHATRPWQYVLEPLSGYLCLAAKLLEDPIRYRGAWNFGPGEDSVRTVHQLTEQLVADWGGGEVIVDQLPNQAYEATLLHLSIDKARNRLGWAPRWSVDRAIRECAVWYQSVLGGTDAYTASSRQIDAYMSGE
ncbi:MAG: CDP-glucose 4,6-dehydratase [Rhodospirillales bacterium]|nr:CDP-glucose 4,6-dehydratase [Rhodospirillales bacterium]MBO6787689.1 CDP-glucose 4,6-dehydratase [Rhodospirillales bacterium]